MADVKISQLPFATTPVDGTEVLPIVQSATTKQVSIANLTAGRAMSASSLTLTTPLAVTSGGTGIATAAQGSLLSATGADTFSATRTPTLGLAGTAAGTLGLSGSTSGVVTLATAATAGTWTFTLPTSGGTNGFILTTNGSGVTTWTNPTALGVDLDVGTTAITGGTTGRVLYNNAGVLGEYAVTGTGSVVLGTSPTFTTSALFPAGTVSAPGISVSGDTNTGIYFPAADTIGFVEGGVESMRLDSSGNLGLGVTPSTWYSTIKAIEMPYGCSVYQYGAYPSVFLSANVYQSGASTYNYKTSNPAAQYLMSGNEHRWFVAPSGTAGNAISFTQAMTLDASGNLGLGTTTPGFKLDVAGTIRAISSSEGIQTTGDTIGRDLLVGKSSIATVIGYNGSAGMVQASNFSLSSTFDLALQPYGGNVGIGTSSPANFGGVNLQVQNSNIGSILWSNGTHVGQLLASAAAEVSIGSRSNSPLRFGTNDTERARIDTSGNLLVGRTSTSYSGNGSAVVNKQLAIGLTYNNATATDFVVTLGLDASISGIAVNNAATSGTNTSVRFQQNASTVGTITTTNTATAYNTSSDISLKENIMPADSSLASILVFPVDQFDWKSGGHTDYGCVAQKVIDCAPEIVTQGDIWSVDYGRITPRLIKAFQELAAKVSALEAKQ